MQDASVEAKKPNQAKRRGYILRRFVVGEEKTPLEVYCTTSRALIRDKVLGNKKRRVLMFDQGGLPKLFIPKERLADFRSIIHFEDSQILATLEKQKISMKQVMANNYIVVRLTSTQANLLTKIGDEVAGERETII